LGKLMTYAFLARCCPMVRKYPSPGESDDGIALDEDQLRTLLDGFRPSVLFPISSSCWRSPVSAWDNG
jgi:hypothetical protein